MRRFCVGLLAVILCCVAFSFLRGVEEINDTPVNPDGSINIPTDGTQYIPTAGNVIRCDDGTNYPVLRVDSYPDNGPLPFIAEEWPENDLPGREVIRYTDGSGDYLFIRNLYETRRMLNTLCEREGGTRPLHIRLTIPENISCDAFSPWDPERMALSDIGRGDTICLEAWDMFKNGVYYKTLYEIGKEANNQWS